MESRQVALRRNRVTTAIALTMQFRKQWMSVRRVLIQKPRESPHDCSQGNWGREREYAGCGFRGSDTAARVVSRGKRRIWLTIGLDPPSPSVPTLWTSSIGGVVPSPLGSPRQERERTQACKKLHLV